MESILQLDLTPGFHEKMTDSEPKTRLTLIARICDSRDDDAWEEFVHIYQPLVQRFVQRHGLQYADAAEITQEVLSRVANSIESWDPNHQKCTFRGWLYRITRNLTIDFLRKKKAEVGRFTNQDGFSQIADPQETESKEFQAEFERQIFNWAAEKLRPSFKSVNWQAFWLTTVDGQSIEEVARKLDLEVGNVYVARSRIMSRMSKLIQERMSETQN